MSKPDVGAMYEPFAHAFHQHAEDSAYNAHYDRPAMLDLIGDVAGKDVLDVGCGSGYYTSALVEAGACVTAFDASPTLVDLAREQVGDRAQLRVADVEQPLAWIDDGSFDIAVMALVLHHLEDRVSALSEIRRVLRPGGHLVLSTVHPVEDWLRLGGGYFDRDVIAESWNAGWDVRFWRMPLTAWCAEFAEAGFLIERLVEPQPAESMRERDPVVFDRLSKAPAFIAFRLLSP